jgi:hypothetical protein
MNSFRTFTIAMVIYFMLVLIGAWLFDSHDYLLHLSKIVYAFLVGWFSAWFVYHFFILKAKE